MTTLYDATTGRAVAIYRTDGTLIWGDGDATAPDTPTAPVTPPNGPRLNVVTRASAGANGANPVGGTGGTLVGTRHLLVVDVADAVMSWTATHEYGPDGGGTFRAAYSINDGPVRPITFDGAPTWYVKVERNVPVVTWTADPVALNAHAGDVLTVYVHAVTDSTASVISDQTRQTPSDVTATGSWDAAMMSLTASRGNNGAWSYRPARVVAPSDKTSWLVVGDSIMQQPWSYGERALDARGLAGVKSAMGGDSHMYYPGRWQERVGEHVATSPYMIDQFGVNGPTSMTTNGLNFWKQSKGGGARYIVKTTISPTTLQGATLDRPDSQTANAWLRDGAPITADKSAALPTGTTDSTAVRCDVIRPDGTIKKGTGGHPIDAVSDTAARIEASPGYLSDEAAAALGGDKLHPTPAVHAMLADRLARDLEILGF